MYILPPWLSPIFKFLLNHTSVQLTHVVGPRTETLIHVPVCARSRVVAGFPQVK